LKTLTISRYFNRCPLGWYYK